MAKDPREDSPDEDALTSSADRSLLPSFEAENVAGGAVARIELREGTGVGDRQTGIEIIPPGTRRGQGRSQAQLYASIRRRNMFILALIVVVVLLAGTVLWQQSTAVTTTSVRTSAPAPTTTGETTTVTSSRQSPSVTQTTSASATESGPSSLANSTTVVASARWGPAPFEVGFQGVVLDAIPPFAPDAGSNSPADIWTIDGGGRYLLVVAWRDGTGPTHQMLGHARKRLLSGQAGVLLSVLECRCACPQRRTATLSSLSIRPTQVVSLST